jgi:hypothetical protein
MVYLGLKAKEMTDEEFRLSVEALILPEEQFDHIQHVRLGWIYFGL